MNTPRPPSLALNLTRVRISYRPRRSLLAVAQALGLALSLPLAVSANPSGAQIIQGNVVITPAGNVLNINSSSPLSIINWQSFSIANGERVNINQQSAGDLSVNRVVGASRSMLDGTLWSNGRVVLINPNGITVGPTGMVDVAGFVASTLNQSDADILSGRRRFVSDANSADVQILGTIKASSGDIYLLGRSVQNAGILEAKNGKAVLAAGEDLELVGSGLNNIRFNVQNTSNEVRNLGAIDAGAVGLFAGSLTHSGTIRATAISQDADGKVILQATPGKATVDGQITARGPNDKGGYVAVLGKEVHLQSNTQIDANGNKGGGEVLIGGDWQGQNPDIQQAEKTTMDAGAKITANALDNGDGGKVVLWSTGETKFKGMIEAKGGANGGNGGDVEVSGKERLIFSGTANTLAAQGRSGSLLLDPTNMCIHASSTVSGCFGGANSFIDKSTIETALNTNGSFTIQSDYIGSSSEVFTVDWSNSTISNSTLTLKSTGGGADPGINIQSTVGFKSGANGGLAIITTGGSNQTATLAGKVEVGTLSLTTTGDVFANNTANNIQRIYGSVGGELEVKSTASTLILGGANGQNLDVQGEVEIEAISGAIDVAQRVKSNSSFVRLQAADQITIGQLSTAAGSVIANDAAKIEAGGALKINGAGNGSGISGNTVTVKARGVQLQGGSGAESKAYIRGDQSVDIKSIDTSVNSSTQLIVGGNSDVTLTGGAGSGATAAISSDRGGKVNVESANGIVLTGGSGNGAYAAIGSVINRSLGAALDVGSVSLKANNLTLSSNGADALIVTQGDQLTVSGNISLPTNIYRALNRGDITDLTEDSLTQLGWLQIGKSNGSSETATRITEIRSALREQLLAVLQERQKQKRDQAKDDIRVEGSDAECR